MSSHSHGATNNTAAGSHNGPSAPAPSSFKRPGGLSLNLASGRGGQVSGQLSRASSAEIVDLASDDNEDDEEHVQLQPPQTRNNKNRVDDDDEGDAATAAAAEPGHAGQKRRASDELPHNDKKPHRNDTPSIHPRSSVHSIGNSSGGSASGGGAAPEADMQRFFVAEMDQTVHEAFEEALAKLKSNQLVSEAGLFKAAAKSEADIRSFTESLTLLCFLIFVFVCFR
jgi:hypothetical protein